MEESQLAQMGGWDVGVFRFVLLRHIHFSTFLFSAKKVLYGTS
jgi:hypothetical protein